ncbi:NAD(P)/FAD-dependent oxidoreductase [Pseudonocardia sp. KRD-184]|uniref:NAD(P)/FAD-dependent oxidoreductase n=1 Tax=Pseudonocardia oceani TaxID=2792013 RepID=A0ABS6UC48_9PSEU|nr:FAD-dependent oxidoreductase [Pseudonocardia oceani]MBW0091003.1 NAD(P)/FAD-dependent oxidoreductase [Pseudonocardia oceani]MBW0097658.1 NAD(P)/FAD-dependent oxidoreductase [Pseudonocardia oceani]MBW0110646.1 NAD(P)/FAD-dependent oxidoreductase [Pseudonocardia oceani]MBW0124214.1 NAD(P)/FAD-dependent oxidoreductase [Pseudonocardia oceani]MBW0129816.1 NAD(P)/FAD-dependent oxidoreductase [Pseudonocardia oceani]
MSRRVVVVGNGMVGARLCDEVRRRDPDGRRVRLTVLGAEPRPAYNRVLLSTVLAGGLTPRAVQLYPGGWAARRRIDLRLGVAAVKIDRGRRVVLADDGSEEPYDELVLATGSRAHVPDGPGFEHATAFRDLDDCAAILDRARPGTRFAVLGGGLLGCEAARGLAGRGTRVTLLHRGSHLMERQVDAGAGHVLAATLQRLGVEVRTGVRALAWEPGTGLRLDDGELIDADALVVATGVRAETGLADDAGIATGSGVLVDDRLATSDDRVHAVGDCAQHAGAVAGVVQPGWEQAAVLADLLTGTDPAARYRGTRTVTRLKARDVDLATVGDPALLDASALRFSDPASGRYAALAFRDERVVAGAVLGLPDAAASVVQFFDGAMPVADGDRLALLLGRALPGAAETADPGRLPSSAVVCRCNTVTKGALITAWRAGATDPPALARATRATTGCGSCGDTVRGICSWLAHSDPSESDPPVLSAVREGAA